MNKNIIKILILAVFVLTSCTTTKKAEPEDEFAVEADSGTKAEKGKESTDELSLDEGSESKPAKQASADTSLENELDSLSADNVPPSEPPKEKVTSGTIAKDATIKQDNAAQQTPPPEPLPPVVSEAPVEVTPSAPGSTSAAADSQQTVNISNLTYKSNDNGGTVIITGDQPMKFTTRLNSITNQLIVEVQNSTIPEKFKRSLNTKDMASSIGSVDIYQKPGSNVSRFVVQMRPGTQPPIVQPEGNTLLVIGASMNGPAESVAQPQEIAPAAPSPELQIPAPQEAQTPPIPSAPSVVQVPPEQAVAVQPPEATPLSAEAVAPVPSGPKPHSEIVDLTSEGIMSSDDLEEFLISNNKFYGKKISIETNRMELKEAFKFLAEESGVNMIIDETVNGAVSLKLKNVPWDQAFVLILKTKKLGFKRQGNVLRIGKIEDFKQDEAQALVLKEARKAKAPLIIKRFFIGYAKLKDLEEKIGEYLTQVEIAESDSDPQVGKSDVKVDVTSNGKVKVDQKAATENATSAATRKRKATVGKVIADERTNSIIVTDTEENMVKIAKLIEALDTQPQQVLIESKVVEAKESFTRGLGVNWNSVPSEVTTVNRFGVGINPILDAGAVVFNSTLSWGQLDIIGRLNAQLLIGEREDKVRVLSAPRITVLTNEQANISQTAGILIPESVSQGNSVTVTNKVIEFGVNLQVTPVVSNEGTVVLTMNLERSFLARVDATAPEKRTAKTKLVVKSGQTAVVGGIFESETRTGNSGVPGLSKIPILGSLFRSEAEGKSKNELIIFVTPTVMKPVAGTEKTSNDLK